MVGCKSSSLSRNLLRRVPLHHRPEGPTCNSHAREGVDQKLIKTMSAEGAT